MGKKMGENSKAVAARDRKNEKDQQQKAVKDKAMEDAKWADDDKALAKKQVGNSFNHWNQESYTSLQTSSALNVIDLLWVE